MLGSVNAPGAAYLSVKTRLRSLELELDRQEKLTGSGDPTAQTPAQVGQIYINTATGGEWKCVESGAGGTVWEKREPGGGQSGLAEEVAARLASLEKALSGQEKLTGAAPPTAQTPAQVGQIYINTATGEEWKCVESGDSGTVWEKLTGSTVGLTAADVGARPNTWTPTAAEVGALPESAKGTPNGVAGLDAGGKVPAAQLPSLAPFVAGASAPADKAKLWIDTTANTGGLKYWNGSAWVHVPVAYT